jgi:hypothetical protein
MTKPVHPSNEIEFRHVRPYWCSACEAMVGYSPCVGCTARAAKAVPPETALPAPASAPRKRRGGGVRTSTPAPRTHPERS